MKKRLLLLALLLLPLLVLGLGFGAARMSLRPVEVGLVDGRLRPCPPSPNCVCSEEGSQASIAPLVFEGEPRSAFRSLVELLRTESRARLLEVKDDYVHAVFFTPFLRFADDVEFRLDRQAQRIHVRSASRIGYSDMGANRARIEELRRRWSPPSER